MIWKVVCGIVAWWGFGLFAAGFVLDYFRRAYGEDRPDLWSDRVCAWALSIAGPCVFVPIGMHYRQHQWRGWRLW